MKIAGLAAAPANAHESVLAILGLISKQHGEHGAVRESLHLVIK